MNDRVLPWLRYTIADVQLDVEGLTPEAEGVYHRVVRLVFSRGPQSKTAMATRFGAHFAAVEHLLTGDEHASTIPWVQRERDHALALTGKKSRAGQASASARAERNIRSTPVEQEHNTSSTPVQVVVNGCSTGVEHTTLPLLFSCVYSVPEGTASEKERARTRETERLCALRMPFTGEAFTRAWDNWVLTLERERRQYPSVETAQTALDQLRPFDEAFATGLLQRAAAATPPWQAFVFDDTLAKYRKQQQRPGKSTPTARSQATIQDRNAPHVPLKDLLAKEA